MYNLTYYKFFRHATKNNSAGPGPGQYNVSGLSAKGKYIQNLTEFV